MNPFGDNGADLDGEVLFAQDNGPSVLTLVEEHPGRRAYLQRADRPIVDLLPSEHPETPEVEPHAHGPLDGRRPGERHRGSHPRGGHHGVVAVGGRARFACLPSRSPSRSPWMSPWREVDMDEGLHTVDVLVGQGGDDRRGSDPSRRCGGASTSGPATRRRSASRRAPPPGSCGRPARRTPSGTTRSRWSTFASISSGLLSR